MASSHSSRLLDDLAPSSHCFSSMGDPGYTCRLYGFRRFFPVRAVICHAYSVRIRMVPNTRTRLSLMLDVPPPVKVKRSRKRRHTVLAGNSRRWNGENSTGLAAPDGLSMFCQTSVPLSARSSSWYAMLTYPEVLASSDTTTMWWSSLNTWALPRSSQEL